jgi:uncharacterized protein (TIGR02145 family)
MSNIYIPNYEILKVLGEGGMALVYLAEHRLLHNRVALKVLKREFVHNENIRKRFLSEARSMAKMSHPNIVWVTDMVEDDQTVAFVMEYIEGESLKEYLDRKGKLGDEQIQYILQQMLDALEYVHGQGLVHRDIKPSNFMLTPQGKVMLMDFGIAKQLNPGSPEYTSTRTNQQMGTAMYMSPEQIHETKSVTPQSDIYSLGVVLWQMLTGQKPYNMGTLSTFQLQTKIVTEPLPVTNTAWDGTIRKATDKEVEKRFRDAKEFKEALKGVDKGNTQGKTTIGNKSIIEPKLSSSNTSSGPKVYASTTTKKSRPFGLIVGVTLILGLGYLIWYYNKGTLLVDNDSIVHSVTIGSQEWQAENLNVDRFRNGDLIPEVITNVEWATAGDRGEPAWCYFENDDENGKIYGKLYNWYAVNDSRGLAPEGWHIPTDEEWTILTDYLGGEEVAGGKMKITGTTYWESPNDEVTNESGFSVFPGGYRFLDGSFNFIRDNAFFWSATENGSNYAWFRLLSYNLGDVYRDNFYYKRDGFSVRCLRD